MFLVFLAGSVDLARTESLDIGAHAADSMQCYSLPLMLIHRVRVGRERTGTPFPFFFIQRERRSRSF